MDIHFLNGTAQAEFVAYFPDKWASKCQILESQRSAQCLEVLQILFQTGMGLQPGKNFIQKNNGLLGVCRQGHDRSPLQIGRKV